MTAVAAPTLDPVAELLGHEAPIRAMAFQGALAATADMDMRVAAHREGRAVRTWDVSSKHSRGRAVDRMRAISFDGLGRIWVAAGRYLWCLDPDSDEPVFRYQAPNFLTFLVNSPVAVAGLRDGSCLASFEDGTVKVFGPSGWRVASKRDNDAPNWMETLADGETVVGADAFSWSVWRRGHKERATRAEDHVYGMAADPAAGTVALWTASGVVAGPYSGELTPCFATERGLPALAIGSGLVATTGVAGVSVHRLSGELVAVAPISASETLRPRDAEQGEPEHHRPTAVRLHEGRLWVGVSNGQVLGFDLP